MRTYLGSVQTAGPDVCARDPEIRPNLGFAPLSTCFQGSREPRLDGGCPPKLRGTSHLVFPQGRFSLPRGAGWRRFKGHEEAPVLSWRKLVPCWSRSSSPCVPGRFGADRGPASGNPAPVKQVSGRVRPGPESAGREAHLGDTPWSGPTPAFSFDPLTHLQLGETEAHTPVCPGD